MFFHIGEAYFGPLSLLIALAITVGAGALTVFIAFPRTGNGRRIAFAVGAGGGLLFSAALLFAAPAVAAANIAVSVASTTYATKSGTIEYERELFGRPQFVFETFGAGGVVRRYCDPARTKFDPGDPDEPTLTVITERGVDASPLIFSVPTGIDRCEVSGADEFLDDYWVER